MLPEHALVCQRGIVVELNADDRSYEAWSCPEQTDTSLKDLLLVKQR